MIWCRLGSFSFNASAGTTSFPHGPRDIRRWGSRQGKGLVSPAEVKEGESVQKTATREKIASALRVAVGVHQCRGVVRTPIAGGYELAAVSSPANMIPKETPGGSESVTVCGRASPNGISRFSPWGSAL